MTKKKHPIPAGGFKPVKSSMIEGVAYDPASQAMHVKFKGGQHYVYHDITPQSHEDMMSAKSLGKHFAEHIRGRAKHSMVEA